MVLLIACANVANLLLARAPAELVSWRYAQHSVRSDADWSGNYGRKHGARIDGRIAGRGTCGRRHAARWSRLVRATFRGWVKFKSISRVLAFAFAATLVTGLLFGLAPALRASRVDLNEALKDAGKSTSGPAAGIGAMHWSPPSSRWRSYWWPVRG
jgi:ABC-type antimicrobial peptide transport system permease subunit